MNMKFTALMLIGSIFLPNAFAEEAKASSTILQAEDVQWGYLNPLRGDKSPAAAELWGDRTKGVPTGMLVKFAPGFSSPPHIHNISYRGLVIEGMVHNDDPAAEKMWMPTGSYWTQPAGENHITAALGDNSLIFLEIDNGPYLVKPADEHFDNRERPVNLHASNLVWLGSDDLKYIDGNGVEVALLWGSTKRGQLGGSLVKFPAGFNGKVDVTADEFRAVIIKGNLQSAGSKKEQKNSLLHGSYFASSGKYEHSISASVETLVYFRTDGRYQISSYE